MTAQEFIEGYARRSGLQPEDIYARGKIVVTCGEDQGCSDPNCPGWAVVSQTAFDEDAEFCGWTKVLPAPERAGSQTIEELLALMTVLLAMGIIAAALIPSLLFATAMFIVYVVGAVIIARKWT